MSKPVHSKNEILRSNTSLIINPSKLNKYTIFFKNVPSEDCSRLVFSQARLTINVPIFIQDQRHSSLFEHVLTTNSTGMGHMCISFYVPLFITSSLTIGDKYSSLMLIPEVCSSLYLEYNSRISDPSLLEHLRKVLKLLTSEPLLYLMSRVIGYILITIGTIDKITCGNIIQFKPRYLQAQQKSLKACIVATFHKHKYYNSRIHTIILILFAKSEVDRYQDQAK
ncbi:hypothetical protein PHYBLDRAFT_171753 [Phycomyces blakesleeanus NRRL 1555(-)]|uniref:Uncharacterized protein n=1 Tax=Phycomyces blakesleeanus (strain ATCC 8743b / DSM 1359 / FGSC 10004 / NBRC 33097 / NRRL 1555) TaxID=763407 RepID=A0A167LG24_PHYB8|nr:hypothetical protein PHYBLDRAFT_171753 [Phycomyces blakesleeanus NRRL 1555(-)]OAD70375.1 hypothetical protein PHYBLDRAFT_171753 [Phycomyces blakesleeanus NRRL 1555(-)]|eukprot:XP_018288415.1 hypothetical protein PHYBLDRAFT_171753 [Phycomyces blakesleeanus NRRL 1555(-)]